MSGDEELRGKNRAVLLAAYELHQSEFIWGPIAPWLREDDIIGAMFALGVNWRAGVGLQNDLARVLRTLVMLGYLEDTRCPRGAGRYSYRLGNGRTVEVRREILKANIGLRVPGQPVKYDDSMAVSVSVEGRGVYQRQYGGRASFERMPAYRLTGAGLKAASVQQAGAKSDAPVKIATLATKLNARSDKLRHWIQRRGYFPHKIGSRWFVEANDAPQIERAYKAERNSRHA
jgi:hypothetical protein